MTSTAQLAAGCDICGGTGFRAHPTKPHYSIRCDHPAESVAATDSPRAESRGTFDFPEDRQTEIQRIFYDAVNDGRTPNGVHLHPSDRELLRALAEAWGEDNVVPVRWLANRLDFCHGLEDYESRRRLINAAAERLRNDYGFLEQGLVLGSYRNYKKELSGGITAELRGFFWVLTEEEGRRSVQARVQQALTMLRGCSRVTKGPLAELSRSADSQYQLIFGADPTTHTGTRPRKRGRKK